jgi:crotonobetainyl-CoA:carnitine CoA-transferase CaiB-like acyl-CoA transferase
MTDQPAGVLCGIRVAAFTHFAAGPLAAQFLGALGADVVKVEAPGGDLNRTLIRDPAGKFPGNPYFVTLNRNQRGIALNLRHPRGVEAARRLMAAADVVLENQKPGAMEKFGLGYEEARQLDPRIIYCSISGFDRQGPKGDHLGQDLLTQALSGLADLSGSVDGPPVPTAPYVVDAYTSMAAVIGILGALRHRDATGAGQWVRTDMMSAALHMMCQDMSYVMNVDPHIERSGAGIAHPHQSAPYGTYQARDGAFVLSLCAPQVTAELARRLGVFQDIGAHCTADGVRTHRDDIAAALSRAFAPMVREEAMQVASDCGLWVASVRSPAEALEDPAVLASGILRSLDSADAGPHRVVTEPLAFSETPLSADRPAPSHGQHTADVLGELGYDAGEVASLVDCGAVVV